MDLYTAAQRYRDALVQRNQAQMNVVDVGNGFKTGLMKAEFMDGWTLPRAKDRFLRVAAKQGGQGDTELDVYAEAYRIAYKGVNPFKVKRARDNLLRAALTGGPIVNTMG